MIGVAAGVLGSSFVLGPIAEAIAVAYNMGSAVNEYINNHIETLKTSENPTIASTGRVLEGAKFGFGLGYVAPMVIIATGQLLLGNSFSAVIGAAGTVMSAVTFTNPIAMTCAAVGAIYFGWTALTEAERNDILDRLSKGLNIGIELIKSFVSYVFGKLKDFSDSKQLAELKNFVMTQTAVFGKTLYDVTKSLGDLVKGAAEKVSNIAGQAAENALTATKKAADVASQVAEKVSDIAGQAADSTVNVTKKAADATTQAAGSVSDAASVIAKSINKKIKGTTDSGQ
ncbi:MAG: hypothetical protein ACOYB1_11710 [Limnohabitans sp.]